MLIKRKSRHLSTDTDRFLTKKRENGMGKNLKYLSHSNSTIKRNTSHGQIKRLNNGIFSKYSLSNKDKVQFKFLINQSNLKGQNESTSVLTEKIKLKTIFNSKYFKNLYQKINHIQNNLRDYVYNESKELKPEQDICNKLLNFGFKNTKSNTLNNSWNFSQINKKNISLNEKSNHRDVIPNSKNDSDSKSSHTNNLSNTSIKPIIPSPKIKATNTVISPVNVESKSEECTSKDLKTDLSQSVKKLNESSSKLQNKKVNNDDSCDKFNLEKNTDDKNNSKIDRVQSKEVSSTNVIIEKTIVLPETEVVPSENSGAPDLSNNKKNRKGRHTRSSAVCLSSNEIKGILDQSKKNKDSLSSKSKPEGKLNDTVKFEGSCQREALLTNESLERKKLLFRDNYQPSLTTLNSTQFCYNNHFPTIRIPYIPRSSQTTQQSCNNSRRRY